MAYARAAATIATPIGPVRIEAAEGAITGIWIGREAEQESDLPVILSAKAQLAAYFAGELRLFDLPLAPAQSDRAPALRDAICAIGYGETASYGELAVRSGSSPRAVGQACARNPFPIVVPCHRVLAARGGLGHYSAGDGAATKIWLLKHERAEAWLL